MEEDRWEPGSGFRVLVGLEGCNKQRRAKSDSRDCVLSDSYNGEDHGSSRLGCDMQQFRKECEFGCRLRMPSGLSGKTKQVQGGSVPVVGEKIWDSADETF